MNERRMYATVAKGQVQIGVEDLFLTLDDKAKRRVARSIAFDQHLVQCVVEWLLKGEVTWDDPNRDSDNSDLWDDEADIPWYIQTGRGTVLEDILLKLIEGREELATRLAKDLILERDRITWERDQYQRLCWNLKDRWHHKDPPEAHPNFGERMRLTDDEVKKIIEAKEKEISEGPQPKE